MAQRITVEEMVAEMERLRKREPDAIGLTSSEWGEVWGMCQPSAVKHIRRHIAEGVMKLVGKKPVTRIDGTPSWAACYAPVTKRRGRK